MKIRHIILMLLNRVGGKITSKTKLHKEIYFLSLLLKKDFGFGAHYYGPYSFEVEQGLDELIGAGFVNVSRSVLGIDANKGFEIKRYEFELADPGKELAESFTSEYSNEYAKIDKFIDDLEKMGDPDYVSLSIAAKAYFILDKENKALSTEQIKIKARDFKWDVETSDINKAVTILEKLNLVSATAK